MSADQPAVIPSTQPLRCRRAVWRGGPVQYGPWLAAVIVYLYTGRF